MPRTRKNKNRTRRKTRVNNNRRTFVGPVLPAQMRKRRRGRTVVKMPTFGALAAHYAPMVANRAASLVTGGLSSLITGTGAYKIKKNSLLSNGIPTINNKSHAGGTVLRHSEYLGDISGSTGFVLTTYRLNPGLPDLFPWGSQVFKAFEEYEIQGMVLEFKTNSGSVTTGPGLGNVGIATAYDPLDPPFANKQQFMNYEGACSSVPSESFFHGVECQPQQTTVSHRYIRDGPIPANSDLRLYDWGTVYVMTNGNPSAAVLGELWISYQIEVFKPKFTTALDNAAGFDKWGATVGISAAAPFGTARSQAAGTNMTGTFPTNLRYNFQAGINTGRFLVMYQVTGLSTATVLPTIVATNLIAVAVFLAGGTSQVTNFGTTCTTAIFIVVYDVSGLNPFITFSGGTYPATATSMDWLVIEVPPTFTQNALTKYFDGIAFSSGCSISDSEEETPHNTNMDDLSRMMEMMIKLKRANIS
jgi:hypothetical protein